MADGVVANIEEKADFSKSTTEKSENSEEPSEELQKHPLQNEWKFWFFEPSKERNWEQNLKTVCGFNTVEDFWAVYNHIKNASELRVGCSYFVFKDNLKPMWEDEGNRKGGRWLINFEKRSRMYNLDTQWLEVLLCLIGESFEGDDGEDICGAVVDIRGKMDKISIWTANCKNEDRVLGIGKQLKERLNLNFAITYESHEDTQHKSSSSAKHMFQL